MKKILVGILSFLVILALAGIVTAQGPYVPKVGGSFHSTSGTQVVNIKVNVLKFLQLCPKMASINATATIDPGDTGNIPGASYAFGYSVSVPHPGVFFKGYSTSIIAKGNCPFSVTITGKPILSRKEKDYSGNPSTSPKRKDYLWTQVKHCVEVNLPSSSWDYQSKIFTFEGTPNYSGGWTPKWTTTSPKGWNVSSWNFTTPHNGLIIGLIHIIARADPPTCTGPNNKNWQHSADAGAYKGQYQVTYSVL